MIACDRFGHGQGQPLPVRRVKGIGRFQLLPALIFTVHVAPFDRCVVTVENHTRKVDTGLVLVKELYPTILLESALAPLAVMMVADCQLNDLFSKSALVGSCFH